MRIQYRQALALDIPVLAAMEKLLFKDSPWTQGQFKEEFLGVPKSRIFYCAINTENQIIGYAGVLVASPGVEADVLTVAVLPDYRRQGIAEEFMAQLEQWASEKACPAMMLEVDTKNNAAISLYRKLGYAEISIRKSYYGVGLDAAIMRKELR